MRTEMRHVKNLNDVFLQYRNASRNAEGMANSVDLDQEQSDLDLLCFLLPVCPRILKRFI